MSELELQDAILRHSLQLMRLSAHEQAEVVAIIRDLERELTALLNSHALSSSGKAAIRSLIADAEKVVQSSYRTAAGSLDTVELAKAVAEQTRSILVTALPVNAVLPTQTMLSAAADAIIQGHPAAAWWGKQADDVAFKFAAQVRQGIANAETNQQIIARVVGRAGEPGIMPIARRDAATLVQTAVQTVASETRMATARANSDIVKGVRRITALDGHVCVVCAAYGEEVDGWGLDGKPLGKTTLPFRSGPFHFNDRCQEVFITKSFREMGIDMPDFAPTTRASSAGQIDAKTTFDSFLKRQPEGFADQVLGKGRAELYRSGKLTLRDLVSGTGRPLTIKQLKANI